MTDDGARPIRELALLCAVLDRAVRDLFSINCAKENSKEAHIWFFISEAMSPFSFFWICEELDLCPDGVRKGLTKILDMDIQKSTTIFWENVTQPLQTTRFITLSLQRHTKKEGNKKGN